MNDISQSLLLICKPQRQRAQSRNTSAKRKRPCLEEKQETLRRLDTRQCQVDTVRGFGIPAPSLLTIEGWGEAIMAVSESAQLGHSLTWQYSAVQQTIVVFVAVMERKRQERKSYAKKPLLFPFLFCSPSQQHLSSSVTADSCILHKLADCRQLYRITNKCIGMFFKQVIFTLAHNTKLPHTYFSWVNFHLNILFVEVP